MALRVYNDCNGDEWRVWDVTPSAGAETLGISYRAGWLCFERTDGSVRRRLPLAQVPPAWEALPNEHLELLCDQAKPAGVRPRGEGRTTETQQRDRSSGPKSAIGGDEDES